MCLHMQSQAASTRVRNSPALTPLYIDVFTHAVASGFSTCPPPICPAAATREAYSKQLQQKRTAATAEAHSKQTCSRGCKLYASAAQQATRQQKLPQRPPASKPATYAKYAESC